MTRSRLSINRESLAKTGQAPKTSSQPDVQTPEQPSNQIEGLLGMQQRQGNQAVNRYLKRPELVRRAANVQRAAADWTEWAAKPVGEGGLETTDYTFADSGGFIVINGAIDVSEAFLKNLQATNRPELVKILQCAKALKDNSFVLNSVGEPFKGYIKSYQSSGGGRMRFRGAIGPTPDSTSDVERYIETHIRPVFGEPLPDYILNMTPNDRNRLFDLANAKRPVEKETPALTWAKAQTPTNMSQMVNFTEYYLANEKSVNDTNARKLNQLRDSARDSGDYEMSEDDPALDNKQKEVALTVVEGLIGKKLGLYKGKANQGQMNAGHVIALQTLAVVGIAGVPTVNIAAKIEAGKRGAPATITLADVNTAAKEVATDIINADTFDTSVYRGQAKTQLRDEALLADEPTFKETAKTEADKGLKDKLVAEMDAVNLAGYAGTDVLIDDFDSDVFWASSATAQGNKISAKAATTPIPFFTPDGAAYHAEKHWSELKGTTEEPALPAQQHSAYFASCKETIAHPATVTREQGQLFDRPTFYFVRTIPAGVGATAAPKAMRAIVSVLGNGSIKVATYFTNP